MDKMEIWNNLSRPPKEALKVIGGGRLKGMTDINPQWRLKVMTEQFGVIGFGWKYQITERWHEEYDGQVACFVKVNLYINNGTNWSEPIEGIGGSMLLTREKNGLYLSDEGYKMALTDALSVAMKQIGVAADIYAGLWDGSKYRESKDENDGTGGKQTQTAIVAAGPVSASKKEVLEQAIQDEMTKVFEDKMPKPDEIPNDRPALTEVQRRTMNNLKEYFLTKLKPGQVISNNKLLDAIWGVFGHWPSELEINLVKFSFSGKEEMLVK